jgi:hypothetical protein
MTKRGLFFEWLTYAVIGVGLIAMITTWSGCVTEKKRAKICQTCVMESKRTDSTLVTVKERTVGVAVPGPTLYMALPNPCAELCDSLGKLKDGVHIKVPGAVKGTRGGTIFTRGDSLHVRCEADSLRAVITAKDSLIKKLVTIENTVAARCDLEHVTKWDSFFIITGRILWIILIIVAVAAVIRWKFFK